MQFLVFNYENISHIFVIRFEIFLIGEQQLVLFSNKIINLKCNKPSKRSLRTADKDISWFWLTPVPSASCSVRFFTACSIPWNNKDPLVHDVRRHSAQFLSVWGLKIYTQYVQFAYTVHYQNGNIRHERNIFFFHLSNVKLFLDGLKCSLFGGKKMCDTNEVCVIFSNRISREKLDKGN